MKTITVAALALAVSAGAAVAGSPEEDYIAARTAASASLNAAWTAKTKSDDALVKDENEAIAALKARLVAILGPITVKGVNPDPTYSPEALSDGNIESGDVDGLRYADADYKLVVFRTTEKIVGSWLKIWTKDNPKLAKSVKGGMKAVFAEDEFFTYALSGGAAFNGFADLPVAAPSGAAVRASIGVQAQDVPLTMPGTIAVAIAKDGRVTVAKTEVKAKLPEIKACAPLKKTPDARYANCVGKNLKTMPQLADLTREAEALIKTVAGE